MTNTLPPGSERALIVFFTTITVVFSPTRALPIVLAVTAFKLPTDSYPAISPHPDAELGAPHKEPVSSAVLTGTVTLFNMGSLNLVAVMLPIGETKTVLQTVEGGKGFRNEVPMIAPDTHLGGEVFSPKQSL